MQLAGTAKNTFQKALTSSSYSGKNLPSLGRYAGVGLAGIILIAVIFFALMTGNSADLVLNGPN